MLTNASFGQVASSLRTGSNLPLFCKGGNPFQSTDVFVQISGGLGTVNICRSANSWLSIPFSGGGTPGGVSGQVQYNNGGVFGGFTPSGDATINTATGVVTVTKSNGSAFGSAAFQPSSAFVATAGGTMTGKLNLPAATASAAPLNVGQGTAPSTAVNGDLWITSTGLFARIAGVTVQFTSGGSTTSPGGSNGQVQYNNNGVFGGFTPGGDVSFNSGTGAFTVLSSNGSAFGSAAFIGLPVARTNGGLGNGVAGTGFMRDGASVSAGEISGDCTTSGSFSIVCTKSNGTLFGTGAFANIANYLPLGGGTMTGKLNGAASAAGGAGFNVGVGTTPTVPVNGDIWATASGLFAQIGGVTYNLNAANVVTIATGTIALSTTSIASGACSAVQTATATGTLSNDTISADFNADPTSVVGYQPTTTGMLTIFKWPSANTVNFKVCNNTTASITPGPITLNFAVRR